MDFYLHLNPIAKTEPNWVQNMLEGWKNSGKKEFAFCSNTSKNFYPCKDGWLYLYEPSEYEPSEEDRTKKRLPGLVRFRARVIQAAERGQITGDSVHFHGDESVKLWMKCDLVEELRKVSGELLCGNDFDSASSGIVSLHDEIHKNLKVLAKARFAKQCPLVVVQTTRNHPL